MRIERFEDIKAWQEARTLTKHIYEITNKGKLMRDFGLRDQIQRSSVSIMANISEGFDSKSKTEFIQFLHYAKRSVSELQSHFYVVLDQGYIPVQEFNDLYKQTIYIKNLIGGFIRYLLGKSRDSSTVTQ